MSWWSLTPKFLSRTLLLIPCSMSILKLNNKINIINGGRLIFFDILMCKLVVCMTSLTGSFGQVNMYVILELLGSDRWYGEVFYEKWCVVFEKMYDICVCLMKGKGGIYMHFQEFILDMRLIIERNTWDLDYAFEIIWMNQFGKQSTYIKWTNFQFDLLLS